jgi:hypothetical protein
MMQKHDLKFWKSDNGFGFSILGFMWSNFMENRYFSKKNVIFQKYPFFSEKYWFSNFENLTMDSDSPTPITQGPTMFRPSMVNN